MNSPRCYNFQGGSILLSKHQKLGTLLDLVNLIKNGDKVIVEPLAAYITSEILGELYIMYILLLVILFIRSSWIAT